MRSLAFLTCGLLTLAACGGAIDYGSSEVGGQGSTGGNADSPSRGGRPTKPPSSEDPSSPAPRETIDCKQVKPISEDFEQPLDPLWTISTPSGVVFDTVRPIAGAQSVRFDLTTSLQPYLTMPLPSVCGFRIELTVRADAALLRSGTTLLRAPAKPATFYLALNAGGTLGIGYSYSTASGQATEMSAPFGKLLPDSVASIILTVDVTRRSMFAQVSATPKSGLMSMQVPEPGRITGLDLGSPPGLGASPEGSYWVDSLELY